MTTLSFGQGMPEEGLGGVNSSSGSPESNSKSANRDVLADEDRSGPCVAASLPPVMIASPNAASKPGVIYPKGG
jgi:hypothetical protein